MKNEKIVIVSDGKDTHIFVDGKIYEKITAIKFKHEGYSFGLPNNAELEISSDRLPVTGRNDSETIEKFKKLVNEMIAE